MKAGCPVRRIWTLLAEEKYGSVRIRPAMRPVATWLAQLNERIRALVLPIFPDLLIEDGDPELLPTPARERLLEQFAKTYRGRDDADIHINIKQIARFANRGLVARIRGPWKQASSSGELRVLLLRIIWIGKNEECGDIALVAATGRGPYYERALGARALAEMGTSEQRRTLAEHLLRYARSYPKKAIAEALQVAFPSVLSLKELETLIRRHPPDNMKALHFGLSYGISEIARYAELSDPEGFAHLLAVLVTKKPWIDERHRRCSKRFSALRAPLADFCAKLVRDAGDEPVNDAIAAAARLFARTSDYSGNYQTDEAEKRLVKAVSENVGANRQQFWLAIEGARAEHKELQNYHAAQDVGHLWRLSEHDFDWLLADLATKTLGNDKTVALSALLSVWSNGDKNAGQLQTIRDTVFGSKALEDQLIRTLNPPEPEEYEWQSEHKKNMAELKANRELERQNIEEDWRDFRDRLVSNPGKLIDGTAIKDLYHLAKWINAKSQRGTYSHQDCQVLAEAFSPAVATAARDGFVAYWRTSDPGVECARKHSAPALTLVALIGLAIESAQTPDFAAKWSTQDVARATRWAFHELNGFPDWGPDLWVAKPKIAGPIFRNEIRWEFGRKPKHDSVRHVLPTLAYIKEPFRSLAAEWVLSELETISPGTDEALTRALDTIIGAATNFSDRLTALAAARFNSEHRITHRLMWLVVWLGTESDTALDALDTWINKKNSKAKQTSLVIRLLDTMFDDGTYRFNERYRNFARFDPVCRLVDIAYTHVRPKDDNKHEGAYSPAARDGAQRARSNILGILLDTPGEVTYRVLLELSETTQHAISSERFRVLANRHATADANLVPWKPGEVVEFANAFEKLPKTLEDLHNVVLDRLWDIEDDVRVGRFSSKTIWRQDDRERADERIVQLGIAQELSLRSKEVYSVEREPELESFDEPDISVQRAGIDEPLPIEIKVADSWSYTQLCKAISGQLIGKYMRQRKSTHGHLVITYHGKKKHWRPRKGKRPLDFPNLVLALQQEADDFSHANRYVTKVSITGINLMDLGD